MQAPKLIEAPRPKRKAEGFDSPRPKRKAEGFSESDCSEEPEAEAAAETPPAKENEPKDGAGAAAQKPLAKEPDDADQEKRLGTAASCTILKSVILQRSSALVCFCWPGGIPS